MQTIIPVISPQGQKALVNQHDLPGLSRNGWKVVDDSLVKWATSKYSPAQHPEDPLQPGKSAEHLRKEQEAAEAAAKAAALQAQEAERLAAEAAAQAEAQEKALAAAVVADAEAAEEKAAEEAKAEAEKPKKRGPGRPRKSESK